MNYNFLQDLRKHYHCIKDDNPLLEKPTEKNLKNYFDKRTKGLQLEDFRNIDNLSGEKNFLMNQLNKEDVKIIQNFIMSKPDNHTGIYKPFSNFLRDKSQLQNKESADFLAFLLDFPFRPHDSYYFYNNDKKNYVCEKSDISAYNKKKAIDFQSITLPTQKYFSILIIVFLSITGFNTIKSIFRTETTGNIIDNKSTTTNIYNYYYYYYQDSSNLKFIPRIELTDKTKLNNPAVNSVSFDEYFNAKGVDTTDTHYKLIKAEYFKNLKTPQMINAYKDDEKNFQIKKIVKITDSVLPDGGTGTAKIISPE